MTMVAPTAKPKPSTSNTICAAERNPFPWVDASAKLRIRMPLPSVHYSVSKCKSSNKFFESIGPVNRNEDFWNNSKQRPDDVRTVLDVSGDRSVVEDQVWKRRNAYQGDCAKLMVPISFTGEPHDRRFFRPSLQPPLPKVTSQGYLQNGEREKERDST